MSAKEKTKILIDVLKAVMLALMTALFGICGWTIINYEKINVLQSIFITIGALIVLIFLIVVIYFLVKEIKKLGDMQ